MTKYFNISSKQRFMLGILFFTNKVPKVKGAVAMKSRFKLKTALGLQSILYTLDKFRMGNGQTSYNALRLSDQLHVVALTTEQIKEALELCNQFELEETDAAVLYPFVEQLETGGSDSCQEEQLLVEESAGYWDPIRSEVIVAEADKITCPHCNNQFVVDQG